jgi:hypothetical protein
VTAPLSDVRLTAVIIREHSSSIVMLTHSKDPDVAATDALREWLWNTPRLTVVSRGRAQGRKFSLTIDGITIKAQKVFAKMAQKSPGMVLVVTAKTPTEFLPIFGYHVRREVHDVELVRLAADKEQTVIGEKTKAKLSRFTIEIEGQQREVEEFTT